MKTIYCAIPVEVKQSLLSAACANSVTISALVREYIDKVSQLPQISERNFKARLVVKLEDTQLQRLTELSTMTNTNLSEVFRTIVIKGVENA